MGTSEQGSRARRDSPRAAPVPLSAAGLEALEDTVSVPAYVRRRVTTGIVHIGVGGFHRAHQALYTQWVLEDSFSAGRPPLETVAVQLVDDVGPYELMKLRLLNAGLQAHAPRALHQSPRSGHRRRLCSSLSDRIPEWLLPVIRAQLESDGEIRRSAAVVASAARYRAALASLHQHGARATLESLGALMTHGHHTWRSHG